MKNNSEEHREGLSQLYKEQLLEAGPFMKAVLEKAILALVLGTKPTRVENWVVKMEKEMRKKI
jgi:uncharacterized protein YciI